MTFFEFASEHPFLTFFLFVIIANAPVHIIRALKGN